MAALVLGGLLYKPFSNQLRRIRLGPYEVMSQGAIRLKPGYFLKELEETDYLDALARTRQAVFVQRAIVFMRSNAPTRLRTSSESLEMM